MSGKYQHLPGKRSKVGTLEMLCPHCARVRSTPVFEGDTSKEMSMAMDALRQHFAECDPMSGVLRCYFQLGGDQ